VNRIGDSGFILGMLLMFSVFGTTRFSDVNKALAGLGPETHFGVLTAMAVLLVCRRDREIGAVPALRLAAGRHGRPHAGLRPDPRGHHGDRRSVHGGAVEPPVPAGPDACLIVAAVGALTAFFAATIAMTQNDIKRVLAYSTVSQLGYMFVALGAGAYWVGIFHL